MENNLTVNFDSNTFETVFGDYSTATQPDPRLHALRTIFNNIELRLSGRYCRYSVEVNEDISKLSNIVFGTLSIPSRLDDPSLDDDYIVAVVIGKNETNVINCTMSQYIKAQSQYDKLSPRDRPSRPLHMDKLTDIVFVSHESMVEHVVVCHVKTLDENTAVAKMKFIGLPSSKIHNQGDIIETIFNVPHPAQ
jgi:hypothetical protein